MPDNPTVKHGFFGRQGGVGTGLYDSLNVHPKAADDPAAIRENRRLIKDALGAETLLTVDQCHSADCVVVSAPWEMEASPAADALVTDKAGIAIGVMTADCAPVLFVGTKADGSPVIGAAHAGWQGALKGVIEETVKAMIDLGAVPESLRAAIGPCIQQASYEVDGDFIKPFWGQDPENEHFFKSARKDGHYMFDLSGYVARRLAAAGVPQVSISSHDTYAEETDYFSYRRATHQSEPDYGRQLSGIAIL
ncbi:MAG: peptidoglycan editing factor PgeF [Rhodospirillales bacterium]|nr:peptidoglycan editing factor PgeF [Rhodospirillales bacterium]